MVGCVIIVNGIHNSYYRIKQISHCDHFAVVRRTFRFARRTYSLDCPPDIPAVRLFRFMFRFCSKTVPERGRRTLRRRSGKRSVAIQVLPENAGYSMVRFVTLAAVTNPTCVCWVPLGNPCA